MVFGGFFGDKRVLLFVVGALVVLLFIIVNSPTLRSTATTYFLIGLLVLAGLPILRRLLGR